MTAPETYTHGHPDVVIGAHATRTVENSAAYLMAHLRQGDRLLDLGCGPGPITIGLGRVSQSHPGRAQREVPT